MKIPNALKLATLFALLAYQTSALAEASPAQSWLKPLSPAWQVKPLLNVGDAVGAKNYRMVGIPDGLGARIIVSV